MYTYLNLCSPLRFVMPNHYQRSVFYSLPQPHTEHTTLTLHYSSSIVLDCRRSFNLISWTKSHQLLPMGPDSQGNKQEFSELRRQQPSTHATPVHLVSNASCDLGSTEPTITFVVPLQIAHRISVSTCSAMHFRRQLMMGVNGNMFWVTTCGWILWNIR